MSVRRLLPIAGPAIGLVLGCHHLLTPGDVAGCYALVSVNGSPPPGLIGATINADTYLTYGDLALHPSRLFAVNLITKLDLRAGDSLVQPEAWSYTGSYSLDDHQIRLTASTNSSVLPPFTGTADGSSVTVSVAAAPLFGAPASLGFRKESCGVPL